MQWTRAMDDVVSDPNCLAPLLLHRLKRASFDCPAFRETSNPGMDAGGSEK